MRGRLIVIEGPDGVGKSTLAELLVEALTPRVGTVTLLREPGTTQFGEKLREIAKDPRIELAPRSEALLFAAARAQLAAERLEPLLRRGDWAVIDRFVLSSLVYQGALHGLDIDEVESLSLFALAGIRPDRVLCLTLDDKERRERLEQRTAGRPDRFDDYSEERKRLIARAYVDLSRRDPSIMLMDAARSPQELLSDALELLAELLPG